MSGDQYAQLAGAVLMLVLVGSGLIARRLPLGSLARMAAGWLLIIGAVLVAASYRAELGRLASRIMGDLAGEQGRTVGGTLRIPMAEDGHFWVQARVNGTQQRFLIDSGATRTAMGLDQARAAGLEIVQNGFPVVLATANGDVEARRARIAELRVGPIVARDLAAVVAPAFGDTNVLGMNFLSSLRSWRVEGRTLILEPEDAMTMSEGA
jgi:aspartyl protease family protein